MFNKKKKICFEKNQKQAVNINKLCEYILNTMISINLNFQFKILIQHWFMPT